MVSFEVCSNDLAELASKSNIATIGGMRFAGFAGDLLLAEIE
jgi:hypothetical protein